MSGKTRDDAAGRLRGVDTNVLVCYFALDDPAQTPLACDFLEGAERRGERLFVSLPVLCETLWTLGSPRYRTPKQELTAILEGLLQSPVFLIQARGLVRLALDDFRAGKADFADYLIGRCAEAAGCSETYTFDRDLAASPGYRLLTTDSGSAAP
ncbi:MAG TPA: type II toxin-antitoxin system VapC family toxin [Thermoanaerobaculia bacterium]|nr:type II toxin-antitoxin system VapC family toxin [Thermoanaerobaculia bacterium]